MTVDHFDNVHVFLRTGDISLRPMTIPNETDGMEEIKRRIDEFEKKNCGLKRGRESSNAIGRSIAPRATDFRATLFNQVSIELGRH